MTVSTVNQCPYCGRRSPAGRRFCNDRHQKLHYNRGYNQKRREEVKAKKAAEQQMFPAPEPVELIGRPEDGPRCACGRVLYPYEHDRCLHCARLNIIAAREGRDFVKRLTSPRRSHKRQALQPAASD
jgi:predicted nucleic acid-binding Zn ribbon protein